MTPPDLMSQGRQLASTTAGAVTTSRLELRRKLRLLRRQNAQQFPHADDAALRRLLGQHRLFRSPRIALYMATGSEFPTQALLLKFLQLGRRVYLPRIRRGRRLDFVRVHAYSHWQYNRHHILEPVPATARDVVAARQLNLIVLPLLGFTVDGQRLGTGGGYYDRTLAFRRWRRHWCHPYLLGLGYAAQRCEQLPRAVWDVPLDAVLTEQALLQVKLKRKSRA